MDQLLTFEFEEVQNSIVTPASLSYGDYLQPYSFLEFLKNTNNNYTPKVYNEFYIEYIKRWNEVKGDYKLTQEQIINSQYKDLLREISLTFSTLQERRFLSNLDFNDPEDLEIAIPFFSRKIKEIVLLYKSSRDKLTFQIEKNKRRGTENSVQLAIRDNVIRFLQDSDRFSSLGISLSSVNDNINIHVDELADVYGEYFNLSASDISPADDYRFVFSSANINDIDYSDFIDLTTFFKTRVFTRTFVEQLGKIFTINADITYDPICQPDNPIGNFLEEMSVGGITPDQYRELRARLIKKFIGTDFYYVVVNGAGELSTGLLFEADNPAGNLLNVNNASTASIISEQLIPLRKIGLYFAPDKQGVLKFDYTKNTYSVNIDDLQQNVTYVFPDPAKYSKVYGSDYPLIFYYDVPSVFNKQYNSNTFGDPKLGPKKQNFFSYYSKQQTYEGGDINSSALKTNLTPLFDLGYVQDWKQDIFGNEYGLLKDKNGEFSISTLTIGDIVDSGSVVKLLPFNGWLYNDPISGYNFDYGESGPYAQFDGVVKSGISLSGGVFNSSTVDQYLNFRQFTPYYEIPSSYDLYPYNVSTDILRILPVDGSKTELSSVTGLNVERTLSERKSLSGTLFVRNSITGDVTTLSSALSSTFSKYSQPVRDQIYNNIISFDVIYETILVRTPNYLVIDKIGFDKTGFVNPITFNLYLSADTYNPFDGISNVIFEPSKNLLYFYKMAVYGDYANDNGKIIYPELYKFDITKHALTKIFPSLKTSINQVSSNFTFTNIFSTNNVAEVGSLNISYNKISDLLTINFIGYDSNKTPYIFDHKFLYDGEEVAVKYSNVYSSNNFSEVSNFYSLSDNGNFFITYTAPQAGKLLYLTTFNFLVSSSAGSGKINLNNQLGYLQL